MKNKLVRSLAGIMVAAQVVTGCGLMPEAESDNDVAVIGVTGNDETLDVEVETTDSLIALESNEDASSESSSETAQTA